MELSLIKFFRNLYNRIFNRKSTIQKLMTGSGVYTVPDWAGKNLRFEVQMIGAGGGGRDGETASFGTSLLESSVGKRLHQNSDGIVRWEACEKQPASECPYLKFLRET